ncbi:MAG: hypothetical protein ACLVJH_11700 [Faecalibacterium prausnitzii]
MKDADFDLAMGGCHIDHLSAPEFDAELAMGDCTIGMLSGAQDVNISVTPWQGRLDPGGQCLGLYPRHQWAYGHFHPGWQGQSLS